MSCLTKDIVQQYNQLEAQRGGTIKVEALRTELARVYKPLQTFELFDFADSAEALQALLAACHSNAIRDATQGIDSEASSKQCTPLCPAHQTFSMQISERLICACGEEGPVTEWDHGTFFLTYYVTDLATMKHGGDSLQLRLVSDADLIRQRSKSEVLPILGKLAEGLQQSMVSRSFIDRCAEEGKRCSKKQSLRHIRLSNTPNIFAISLVWADASPNKLETLKVLASLPDKIDLSEVFEGVRPTAHYLKGMILFSSSHYISMFRAGSDQSWHRFDDDIVRRLPRNADRTEMLNECLRSRQHPVAVFYEQGGTPSPEETEIPEQDWLLLEKKMSVGRSSFYDTPVKDSVLGTTKANDFFSKTPADHRPLSRNRPSSSSLRPEVVKPAEVPARTEYNPSNYKALGQQETPKPTVETCKDCGKRLERAECPDCSSKWRCKNGHLNSEDWRQCTVCYELKPGLRGWKCSYCTGVNEEFDVICKTCYKPKYPATGSALCEHYELSSSCSICKRNRSSADQWTCKFCDKTNVSSTLKCWYCSRPSKTDSTYSVEVPRSPAVAKDSSRSLLKEATISRTKPKEMLPAVVPDTFSIRSPTKTYGNKSYEIKDKARSDMSTSTAKLAAKTFMGTRSNARQADPVPSEPFTRASTYFNQESASKGPVKATVKIVSQSCSSCRRPYDGQAKYCSGCGGTYSIHCSTCAGGTFDAICRTCVGNSWKCSCRRLNKLSSALCSKCRAPNKPVQTRTRAVSRPATGKAVERSLSGVRRFY
jgi:hypothetical protein